MIVKIITPDNIITYFEGEEISIIRNYENIKSTITVKINKNNYFYLLQPGLKIYILENGKTIDSYNYNIIDQIDIKIDKIDGINEINNNIITIEIPKDAFRFPTEECKFKKDIVYRCDFNRYRYPIDLIFIEQHELVYYFSYLDSNYTKDFKEFIQNLKEDICQFHKSYNDPDNIDSTKYFLTKKFNTKIRFIK